MELFIGILLMLFYVGTIVLVYTMGFPSRITLLEHQKGVLYRQGIPVKDIGAGRYWVWTKREKIFWLDMRPSQIAFEGQGAILKDGSTAVFDILGSARVAQPRKAIYTSRNCNEVPAFVLHCYTRSVLNECTAAETANAKERLTADIMERARPILLAGGFEVLSFQVTQLSLAAPAPFDKTQIPFGNDKQKSDSAA